MLPLEKRKTNFRASTDIGDDVRDISEDGKIRRREER